MNLAALAKLGSGSSHACAIPASGRIMAWNCEMPSMPWKWILCGAVEGSVSSASLIALRTSGSMRCSEPTCSSTSAAASPVARIA